MSDTEMENPYQASEVITSEPMQEIARENMVASRGIRLGAYLINSGLELIVIGIPLTIYIVMMIFHAQSGKLNFNQSTAAYLLLGIIAFLGLILVIINILFLAQDQQTIGKKILGIKIVRSDFSRCGFWRIFFLRIILPGFVSSLYCLGYTFWLVDHLLIFRDSCKCLHDNMADTAVIYKKARLD